jgi:C-terminal processing protease CtpA/Prc
MKAVFGLAITLAMLLQPVSNAQAHSTGATSPSASAARAVAQVDDGEGGPVAIVGQAAYANSEISVTGQEPVVALIDMSAEVQRDDTTLAPVEGQIIGRLTAPLAPSPTTFEVPLPIVPGATPVDVGNDGAEDKGVQVFRLALVSILSGGSHLEQLDQWGCLNSYVLDDVGEISYGSFLLYAVDDQQGFPEGVGADGLIFTEDDPVVAVPQGYTIARLAEDGTITFDRSNEGSMHILEPPAVAYPNFSDQGILESYNSLLDTLDKEYAFTELRQLDWDELRANWLPQVEAADAAGDMEAYGPALRELAQRIRDAHAQVTGPGYLLAETPIAANLGANVVELTDGRFVVTEIVPGSPLEQAGVVFGTEIVAVDGQPVEERVPNVIFTDATGTDEGQRLRQVRNLLRFPAGTEVELAYRLPDATETLTATLSAGAYPLSNPLLASHGVEEISYDMIDNTFGYVRWNNFEDPIPTVEPYKAFLKKLSSRDPNLTRGAEPGGLIVDMRSNGGGWDVQYLTMASYLFNAEKPAPYNWASDAFFDTETQTWIPVPRYNWSLSAPDPASYFAGPVVVLVDPSCGSSCEFFTSFLQSAGRVTVVGQYGSAGAGGPVKRATLPGGLMFQYPWQGVVFANSNELVVEAKGVDLDVRVPTTLESEQARLNGDDPVLAAGIATLGKLASEELAASTNLVTATVAGGAVTALLPEGWAYDGRTATRSSLLESITYDRISPPVADLAAALKSLGVTDMEGQMIDQASKSV